MPINQKKHAALGNVDDGAKTVDPEKVPCELNADTKIFLSPDARRNRAGRESSDHFKHEHGLFIPILDECLNGFRL